MASVCSSWSAASPRKFQSDSWWTAGQKGSAEVNDSPKRTRHRERGFSYPRFVRLRRTNITDWKVRAPAGQLNHRLSADPTSPRCQCPYLWYRAYERQNRKTIQAGRRHQTVLGLRAVRLDGAVGLATRREFIAIPAYNDTNRMTTTAPFDLPMKNKDESPPTIIEPAATLRSVLSDTGFSIAGSPQGLVWRSNVYTSSRRTAVP